MKILLATDESKCAMRAVKHVIANLNKFGPRPEIHLLYVQRPLPGRATAACSRSVVQRYYREQSEKVLARARRALTRRGIKHKEVHLIGDPGASLT